MQFVFFLNILLKLSSVQHQKEVTLRSLLCRASGGWHCILLAINIEISKISVYDSRRYPQEQFQSVIDALNRAYNRYKTSGKSYGRYAVDASCFRVHMHEWMLRQPAGNNECGFYIMRYMRYFIHDGNIYRDAEVRRLLENGHAKIRFYSSTKFHICSFVAEIGSRDKRIVTPCFQRPHRRPLWFHPSPCCRPKWGF